jgi:Zn-dependent protease
MQIDLIFGIVVLIFSIVLHEVAHGYMANWLGDPTARLQGRLTLNPVGHIDPLGSIIIPGLLLFTQSPFLIGWAKPVPYNPYNLRGKYGEALVAFAGPGTNILIAVIFGLLIRFGGVTLGADLISAFAIIVYVNILLALFNLIPIPPLDGSKVLSAIFGMIHPSLERGYENFRLNFERLGLISGIFIIFIIFYFVMPYFSAVIYRIFALLTGVAL